MNCMFSMCWQLAVGEPTRVLEVRERRRLSLSEHILGQIHGSYDLFMEFDGSVEELDPQNYSTHSRDGLCLPFVFSFMRHSCFSSVCK